jgi:signal transduction histidine kinase
MNSYKPTKEFANSLHPHFSEQVIESLKLYFVMAQKYQAEMNLLFKKDFDNHPFWGPFMKSMPEDIQLQRQALSQQLLYNAIYNNDWDAYTEDLIMQGTVYAKMGVTFSMWYEIVAIAKDYLIPYVIKDYSDTSGKVVDVINALGKLTDFAMQVIAESYTIEKNKIIEQQQERQAELIKELESFAYIVSHDLKSPLRGISKISEWLLMDYSDKLDTKGKEQLQLLKNRVLRLDDLINGILSYSRLGREKEEKIRINISEVLKDVIGILMPPNHVTFQFQEKFPAVNYQRAKLIQVFSNLFSNAIKYCDKKQCVVTVSCEESPNEFRFLVKDNGPGIEKEYHEKVFQIFQTLQSRDEKESTGIGLSIVKKIIESEGGKTWIESELGAGTAFIFTIPKN